MSVTGAMFWSDTFLKSNGQPYAGARVFTWAAGTTTQKLAWTDEAKTTPAAFPVVADGLGRAVFYGEGDYRLQVRSSIADGDLLLTNPDFEIKLVAKSATLRPENQGTVYPPATGLNRGQLFAKTDGIGNVIELGLQRDTSFKKLQFAEEASTGTVSWSKGADIGSAPTLTLGNDGNFWNVTGTATITAISATPAGTIIRLCTLASLTFQYNVVSLVLADRRDTLTNAGDVFTFVSLGNGNYVESRLVAMASGSVRGCDCSVLSNTTVQLRCNAVTLRNSSNHTFTVHAPSNITVDVSVTGPVVNGRDQPGTFSSLSWLHFYWIGGPGLTLGGIASVFAPPTGPTLPTGYTHWQYAGPIRYNGTPILVRSYIKGSWVTRESSLSLAGISQTAEGFFSLADHVPPNALNWRGSYNASFNYNSSGDAQVTFAWRIVTGVNYRIVFFTAIGLGTNHNYGWSGDIQVPNLNQSISVHWSALGGATTQSLVLTVESYQIPNGSE